MCRCHPGCAHSRDEAQSQIFEKFLEGDTLEACYAAVGSVANHWLDLLYSRGPCRLVMMVLLVVS